MILAGEQIRRARVAIAWRALSQYFYSFGLLWAVTTLSVAIMNGEMMEIQCLAAMDRQMLNCTVVTLQLCILHSVY